MKKLAFLSTLTLTLCCFGGQTLVANAAAKNCNPISIKGNRVILAYGSNCDNFQNIWDSLQNCFPEISLPDCNFPEIDKPETDAPDVEAPEVNIPENNTPDNNGGSDDNITEDTTPEEDSNNNEHAFIKQVVNLVNAERAKEGLSPLKIDTKVQAAAHVRAKECEKSFSHTRPNGSSFATALKEQNVSYRSAGENIAWGQRSPEAVMKAWMNSSGHRANIMNPNFTTIGVGYYQNANGTNYWCQLFTR